MKRIALLSFFLLLISFSCSKGSNENQDVSQTKNKPKDLSLVVYPMQLQRENPFEFDSVEKFIPVYELKIPCDLIAASNQEAQVGSLINGRVKSVLANENDFVREGQILAYIEGLEIGEVISEYLQRVAELKAAKIEKERSTSLIQEKIISEQLFLESEKLYSIAEAKMRASESRCLSIGFTEEDLKGFFSDKSKSVSQLPIRSKITGLVSHRNAVLGQAVDTKETLFQIINLSKVVAKGYVYEPDFGRVKVGQQVRVKLGAYHNNDFVSSIDAIGTVVDENIHAIPIRATLKNTNAMLKPAMHGEMIVYAKGEKAEFHIVKECLGIEGNESFCFLLKDDSTFEFKRVKIIGETSTHFTIEGDFEVGMKVVKKGVFQLKAAMKSSEMKENE